MSNAKQEPYTEIKFHDKVLTLYNEPNDSSRYLSMKMWVEFKNHDMRKVAEKFIYHLENNSYFNFEVSRGFNIIINDDNCCDSDFPRSGNITLKKLNQKDKCIVGCLPYTSLSIPLGKNKDLLIKNFRKFL